MGVCCSNEEITEDYTIQAGHILVRRIDTELFRIQLAEQSAKASRSPIAKAKVVAPTSGSGLGEMVEVAAASSLDSFTFADDKQQMEVQLNYVEYQVIAAGDRVPAGKEQEKENVALDVAKGMNVLLPGSGGRKVLLGKGEEFFLFRTSEVAGIIKRNVKEEL